MMAFGFIYWPAPILTHLPNFNIAHTVSAGMPYIDFIKYAKTFTDGWLVLGFSFNMRRSNLVRCCFKFHPCLNFFSHMSQVCHLLFV